LADYYRAHLPAAASGKLHDEPFFLPQPLKLARRPKGRMLAVLFEQRTCKACDELHDDLFRRREIVTALTNLDVARLDIWSSEQVQTPDGQTLSASQWARRLGVHYTPTWIFFDDQGNEVFRADAWLRPFHLHGVLDYVATRGYLAQPNFQRFLQHRSEVLRAKGFEVELLR
jgi:thioredoxin-related protein